MAPRAFETGKVVLAGSSGRTRRPAVISKTPGFATDMSAEQSWAATFAHEWHGVSLSLAADPVLPGERRTSLGLTGMK